MVSSIAIRGTATKEDGMEIENMVVKKEGKMHLVAL